MGSGLYHIFMYVYLSLQYRGKLKRFLNAYAVNLSGVKEIPEKYLYTYQKSIMYNNNYEY